MLPPWPAMTAPWSIGWSRAPDTSLPCPSTAGSRTLRPRITELACERVSTLYLYDAVPSAPPSHCAIRATV
eukprot:9058782-Lingulodinium_polyedra.AAC.1